MTELTEFLIMYRYTMNSSCNAIYQRNTTKICVFWLYVSAE